MTSAWTPGQGKRRRSVQTPIEGVPEHLRQPLLEWIDSELKMPNTRRRLALEMQWGDMPDSWRYISREGAAAKTVAERVHWAYEDGDSLLLDIIEWCLECGDETDIIYDTELNRTVRGRSLETTLAAGNSAYRVRTDGKGLESRISLEVIQQFEETVTTANDVAAAHLTEAWNNAYSINPDPVKSMAESVKAIEAAYELIISPQNPNQTLGTMIRDLTAAPRKWRFALDDSPAADGVAMVVAMMNQIWKNQQRHSTGPNVRQQRIDEARCSVHIAGTLAQFVSGGGFVKLP